MTQERMNALGSALCMLDQEQIKSLLEKTPAEAQAYFAANGYDFTVEEVETFGKEMLKLAQAANGAELSADELEAVAGGKGEFVAGIVLGMVIGIACFGGW